MGNNGDSKGDKIYQELQQSVFKKQSSINYKHLCGEYPTATSFALWLAAAILKAKSVPESLGYAALKTKSIKKILIYNHYQELHHSLLLLSAC